MGDLPAYRAGAGSYPPSSLTLAKWVGSHETALSYLYRMRTRLYPCILTQR